MTCTQPSTTPVATILDNLDTPGYQVDEMTFLSYGDDLLDFAIGLDSYHKNRWLFNCDRLPIGVYHGDAICVGSGPSLDSNLHLIKQMQGEVLVVCVHSAVLKLLDNGIIPHVVTPKERIPDPPKIPNKLPESVIYAGLPVVQYAPGQFHRHYLVGDSGRASEWMGMYRPDIQIPTTSGTLGASVAASLCTGTIWLVGHDMYQGHYAGFKFKDETPFGTIPCVDGVERQANWVYRSCRAELGRLAHTRKVVQTAPQGAQIDNAVNGILAPLLGKAPNLSPRPTDYTVTKHQNLDRVGDIFQRVISVCEAAKVPADMDMVKLFDKVDYPLGLSIMQPIWLQYSILRRTLNLTNEQVTPCMRESILNAFRAMLPWAKTIHA